MSSGQDEGEKVLDPTPQKLEEERKKGNVPKSMDLSAAAGLIGLYLAFELAGKSFVQDAGAKLSHLIDRSDGYTGLLLAPGGLGLGRDWVNSILVSLLPIFGIPFILALIAVIGQRAVVFSTKKIQPKLSNISLISNAKNKFGPTGLVQFLKSVVKMVAVSWSLFYYLSSRTDEFIGTATAGTGAVSIFLADTLMTVLALACVIFLVIGLIDIFWQRYDHSRKLRMSVQDMKDEHKQSEGDPHFKQQRRQRGQELANNRMLLDVPKADVIIVNPTHYAVALKWSRAQGTAPECVAKGVDEIAARIREIASESGIPIHRDPPSARAIFQTVEIGQEINPDHYKAVAAAIRVAEQLKAKARQEKWH